MNLQPGQKLWFVYSDRRQGQGREVTVEKIGRKWATLTDGDRVSIESLDMDGGQYSSPGRCYLSREEWARSEEVRLAWVRFSDSVHSRYAPPTGVTAEAIRSVSMILKLEVKP